MNLLDTLTAQREFRVFVPDITLQEAMKNEAHVLRFILPRGAEFLEVIQISDPLAGLSALGGSPQTAYTFLVDPEEKSTSNVYVTPVFPHMPFPWHRESMRIITRKALGCETLGITTHSGVPILHIGVHAPEDHQEQFERDVQQAGYRIVDVKLYTRGGELVSLYRSSTSGVKDEVDKQVQASMAEVSEPKKET